MGDLLLRRILAKLRGSTYGLLNGGKRPGLGIAKILSICFSISMLLSSSAWSQDYSNSNPAPENPISDGGKWVNAHIATGSNCYSDVKVDVNHHIIGNQVSGVDGSNKRVSDGQPAQPCDYNDSLAMLSGSWAPDQCAQSTVYIAPTITSTYAEVELFLRAAVSGNTFRGYELQFSVLSSKPYWHVAPRLGKDFLGFGNSIASTKLGRALRDGDVVKGCVIGTTFTISVNGTVIGTGSDSTYASGAPGAGFYHDVVGNTHDGQWGFKNFMGTTNTSNTSPSAPSNLTASPK